ncbi:MAG: GTP-binding protein [Candidatus Micrarchaeia archaeon]
MIVRNIAMLGHKDHGKSTLIGSILMLTGAATQVRVNEAKAYSKKFGKKFEPAFILDSFEEERAGGLTIDTTRAETKYKDMALEFIDVPGHEELIKNMMSGASYANAGILVVSAKSNEGIRDQTKRHVFVAKMLGIEKLVVAVNKMDTVRYSKERYDSIKNEIENFLVATGFEKNDFSFVPISAYGGENLVEKSDKIKWYNGKPLLESLYALSKLGGKDKCSDLRATVQGYIDQGDNTVLAARILSGTLKKGQKISVFPGANSYVVKHILVKGRKVSSAVAGVSAAIKIDAPLSNPRGAVISSGKKPIVSNEIKARVFATLHIRNRSKLELKLSSEEAQCKSVQIKNIINITKGVEESGSSIKPLGAAVVRLTLNKAIVMEKYSNLKSLGRFTIYLGGKFAGIGIVE